MKDLAHFQQQVADINGYETVILLCEVAPAHHIKLLLSKAAELYAEHCFLQGKQEGEAKAESNEIYLRRCWDATIQERDDFKNQVNVLSAIKRGLEKSLKESQVNRWNEALLWAAEHAEIKYRKHLREPVEIDKQSILNGLKVKD